MHALFRGESGTAKTMAATVLAGELDLDLHRIDLCAVVSKYLGETEKNVGRLLEAAEESGAILLFDEAGRSRSESPCHDDSPTDLRFPEAYAACRDP